MINETLTQGQNMGVHGKVLNPGPNFGNPTVRIHNVRLDKSLIWDPITN